MYGRNRMNKEKIGLGYMQRHLGAVLSAYKEEHKSFPVRAIPFAFPLSEVTYPIEERISEPIGFVNRFILKALVEFGPCTSAEINDILCLGENRISMVLNSIVSHNDSVKFEEGKFLAGKQLEKDLENEKFSSNVTQERQFVVNSLTGSLVPLKILDKQNFNQLFLKNKSDKLTLVDQENKEFPFRFSINHAFPNANEHLKSLIKSTDSKQKENYGIPDAAIAFHNPVFATQFWLLSFLTIDETGFISIYSYSQNPLHVDLPNKGNCKEYLLKVCQNLEKNQLEPRINKNLLIDNFKTLPADITPSPDKSKYLISVANPDVNLKFSFNKENSNNGNLDWLSSILEDGVMWAAHPTWGVLEVLPGDSKTAQNICLKKGLNALKQQLLMIESDSMPKDFNPERWWNDFQAAFNEELAGFFKCSTIPFKTLSDLVHLVPDTEFNEKFNRIMNRKQTVRPKEKKETAGILIRNNTDNKSRVIGASMIRCLKDSSNEIRLISPVIDSMEIVEALIEAHARGNNVKIITPLASRTKDQFLKFPTRGFEFKEEKDSLQKHHECVRRLGENGILCRTPKYYPHAKMLIASNSSIIASANITDNSLGWGKQAAEEAGILTHDLNVRSYFIQMFDDLWDSSPFRQHLESKNISIIEQRGKKIEFISRKSNGLLFTISSPPNRFTIYKELVNLVKLAEKQIIFSTFTIYDTEKVPELHNALIKAVKKGVKVHILIRSVYPKGWPDKSSLGLIEAGVRISGIDKLHSKGVLIDNSQCGIFSANLNPYSLNSKEFSAHIEMGLFGSAKNPALLSYAEYLRTISRQGKKI